MHFNFRQELIFSEPSDLPPILALPPHCSSSLVLVDPEKSLVCFFHVIPGVLYNSLQIEPLLDGLNYEFKVVSRLQVGNCIFEGRLYIFN